MIYKWNIVKANTFKEIFNTFWDKIGDTAVKVLEIQNLETEDPEGEPVRLFFGDGIKMSDWKEFNQETYGMILSANKMLSKVKGENVDLCGSCVISMCMTNEGPRVTPLRTESERRDLIFKGMIDDSIDSISDPKARTLAMMSKGFLKVRFEKNGEGYIRVRALDIADWKEHVTHYSKTGTFKEEFTKDDKFINLI